MEVLTYWSPIKETTVLSSYDNLVSAASTSPISSSVYETLVGFEARISRHISERLVGLWGSNARMDLRITRTAE